MSFPQVTPGRPSNTLHFIVGEMSGKLDQVLSTLLLDRKRVDDLEDRVAVIEKWRWKLVGSGSIIVLILSSVEAFHYAARR